MLRKIVSIDRDKCNGCGLCIGACHEGALKLVDGKAELISDSYCDGLGACLPECPTGAINIVEREAADFDEEEVKKIMAARTAESQPATRPQGCPGSRAGLIARESENAPAAAVPSVSQLRQWPCQIKLVPANAPYFDGAHLLVAADCTAYAYANMHADFMRNKITLIGCPKLDDINYAGKLAEILRTHDIKSLTVVRMEVPCCGGIVSAVKEALLQSGKLIPWRVVVIGTDGTVRED
ncbi:MAG TPA: 4Fe-4S binding protein [Selenomonadales bacterium]|nr:4Fe-4S binding protein [Selenomonadales bacterium]